MVLLGGPIANDLSRKLMGFDGTSELVREDVDGIALRFPIKLDYGASLQGISAGRFRRGRNGPIPIWHDRSPDGMLVPESKDGRLTSDYLHIVSLPNVFSSKAYEIQLPRYNFSNFAKLPIYFINDRDSG
jgi:hypothetical protein